MEMTPLVSVIIPVYNRKSLLDDVIKSVYAQTWKKIELIIVDDASTEDVFPVVKKYHDKGIIYHRLSINSGAPRARNIGVSLATGEYIAFLDSDDTWDKSKIEKQVSVLSQCSSTGLVYTGIRKLSQEGRLLGYKTPNHRGRLFQILLNDNVIGSTSVVMLRKEVFLETGGFDEELKSRQDLDLWLRCSKITDIDFVPEPLVNYLVHNDRISTNYLFRYQGYLRIFEKYKKEILLKRKTHQQYLFYLGYFSMKTMNYRDARNYFLSAFKVKPTLKTLYYLLKSVKGTT